MVRKKEHLTAVATAAWTASRATLEVTGTAGNPDQLREAFETAADQAKGVPTGSIDALVAMAVMTAIRDALSEAGG